jgi:PKD repeat protein
MATPMSGSAPFSVTFTGTGTDPDGVWLAYAWNFGDGISSKVKDTTHTYVSAGTYTATLTVIDADLAEGKATVKITVAGGGNQRPVASVSANPMSGTAPLQVGFSGSGSDPDGTIASYAWAFGDGGTSTQQVTTHTYQSAGTYTATLTVTDNGGATGSASVQIAVSGTANQPPRASASASPTSGPAPLAVAFTGSGTDPDGTIASYAWTFGDGGTSTLQSPSHTYQSVGSYTATLTVTDNGGATGSATVNITVGTNQPPTATASATPTSGRSPLAVAFTGSGTDPDGTIASYAWTFGDGGTSTLQSPSHTYQTAGSYTATLTVTDNGGARGSATVGITVQQGNRAPTANAGADQLNRDPGTTISLNGSASLDVDGDMLSYQWTQTAGPAVTLTGANTATPSFTTAARTTATYTFTLTVTDNGSPPLSGQDSVNVSARVTYVNTIRTLYSDRGLQSNGKKLGCVGCHAPGLSRPQSPLTTYAEVYNWRTQARSLLISGGSMRQYLLTGEPQVIIDWIDAGAPQTN